MKRQLLEYNDFIDAQVDRNPVIYTGFENGHNTYMFLDEFNTITIPKLILDIESIRQSGSYNTLDLYFQSCGGDIDMLMDLANYLNSIDGLSINLIVNGRVASAGFFILLLINNPNIEITIGATASAMIHLGGTYVSTYGLRRKEHQHHNVDSFMKKHLDYMNEEIILPMCKKIGLSDEDILQIDNGGEVWLNADELINALDTYNNNVYLETEAEEDINILESKKKEYLDAIKEIDKSIKDVKRDLKTIGR